MSKVIGIDIDGVLTREGRMDNNIWKNELEKYVGRKLEYKKESYDLCEVFGLPSSTVEGFIQDCIPRLYRQVDSAPGAREVLQELKKQNCKLYLITARHGEHRSVTVSWLKKHKIPYDRLFHEDDKGPLAAELGVDAVSILTPMFIDPNQQELYEHYKTVAEQVDIPVLLYNNPGRTGVNLEAKLIEKLSKIDNIVGIKDSSGDMTLTGEYIRRTGEDFKVLAGRDTLILSTLTYGGKGSITATANIAPRLPVKIYEEYIKGNMEKALEAQYELAPLRLAFSYGTFPVVMKEGLNLIGIDTGPTLKPVGPLSEEKREKLKNILKDLDLI